MQGLVTGMKHMLERDSVNIHSLHHHKAAVSQTMMNLMLTLMKIMKPFFVHWTQRNGRYASTVDLVNFSPSFLCFFSAEVYLLHLDLKDDKNSYVVFIGARPLSGART